MTTLQTLKFFVTPEHDCSYLDDQKAQTLFVDPAATIDSEVYSQLSNLGFRRSGAHIYRPHCRRCNACISVRLPVNQFTPSRSQKRLLNRNKDLRVETIEPTTTDEIYELYARYINERHADGDMYPPSVDQFTGFLVECRTDTQFHLFRDQTDQLLAVAVTDRLKNGLSAVYTFFNPDHHQRSLGSYAILWQIQATRDQALGYLYLGYWVAGCRKMDYKTQFGPLEQLDENRWKPL